MAEAAVAATPEATPAAAPWHQGIEADVLGSWQNKGLDISDPAKLSVELTKHWKAAERHVGAPADQILRLPANQNDSAAWKQIWERLGAPREAKDYEITGEGNLVDAMRTAFGANNVPKDAAKKIAEAVIKSVEGDAQTQKTLNDQRKIDTLASLQREWGAKYEENRVVALDGARRLGLSQEQLVKVEDALGWDVAAKLMHRIGVGLREPGQLHGGDQTVTPTTAQAAEARLKDLMSNKDWVARLQSGDKETQREWNALFQQKLGINEADELAQMRR